MQGEKNPEWFFPLSLYCIHQWGIILVLYQLQMHDVLAMQTQTWSCLSDVLEKHSLPFQFKKAKSRTELDMFPSPTIQWENGKTG